MRADVVLLPKDLTSLLASGRSVVVFDVLRATTSMLTALSSGAKEIRVFPDLDSARAARSAFDGPAILCGEQDALPPPGFDLGNSPGSFTSEKCEGKTLFMRTTNGTRAILAAGEAAALYVAALVNAEAAARALAQKGLDVTLLCSGTNGAVAMEDLIGAGAVLDALSSIGPVTLESDLARIALSVFTSAKPNLAAALRATTGGQNVQRVNLTPDIEFAATLNRFDIVGVVIGQPPTVVRGSSAGA